MKGAKWYEYLLSALILAFQLVWGNIYALVKLFPLMGGVIGALVALLCSAMCLYFMSRTQRIWLKFIIFIAFFSLSFAVCYLLALAYLK